MRTKMCEMFGIDLPIFAFSHCRDVVAAVSKAGGLGVLGCAYYTPERLREELQWIDRHVDGKPYGVDVLLPAKYEKIAKRSITAADLPPEQTDYLRAYLDAHGIPPLPPGAAEELIKDEIEKINFTREQAERLIETALEFPIKLVVNALGAPPREMVESLQARGIRVGGMVGSVEHASKHVQAGVDLIIAQGMEAGGHTGDVTSMILWPQVVDAVAPIPVLAAGGIGRGRQMAAALALGAEGIWCGSIWLGTTESDLTADMKAQLFKAKTRDAYQSFARTGKQCRILKSKLTEAWDQPDAPSTAPLPLQTAVMAESRLRIERARAVDWLTCPVGQIVGEMNESQSTRQVVYTMLDEFVDTMQRMDALMTEAD
ncbi:nitronate monooxygenase [Variibacter gotjawalensis]|uniref:Nitronate monooxygenase n=1 Tax=Variibacter gotjawalensis TaxID=1333996 RepID=A0A0S3PVJ9_9BRAD|nr:nitronate monooxygenase family protein [Variibacter gotjawalensis]NIK45797.1 NAD(P)H-dependent flavin oxidoreductase YrpB (nitropropane dioxygenase family) [Variibacter gotjawalensis]RZS47721.1 NAD(P)H-dependent flavin oxidoreductase YrpB (nitropropane dioxygenase family) [Variibacter gotjawalensis]BAT59975.1 nitronate monooxygenase [Variibacter gotjawalensis]